MIKAKVTKKIASRPRGRAQADIQDVFEAVGALASHMDKKFENVESRLGGVESQLGGVEGRLGGVEEEIASLKRNMVTKTYLDERIGDVRGDITQLVHKSDRKFTELVHTLENKDVLSEEDAVRILSMPPFPLGQHTP